MLTAFLDYQRGVVLRKVAGLDDEQLRRPMTATGLTLLGFVKHIAYVERWWFRVVFAGEPVEVPWTDEDPDADWRVEADDTPDAIVALYLDEIERSRAIASRAELDEVARNPRVQDADVTMRWILLHMIEEIARHLGHADVMREAIDGATGD
jgi:uncharacterized damage-inducible protein DinB